MRPAPYFRGNDTLRPGMILTCPSCSTRYSVEAEKFPSAGRTVRCAKCGHSWHQPGPEPETGPDTGAAAEAAAPHAETAAEAPAEPPRSPTRAFAPAAAAPAPRAPVLPRLAVAAGWIGLIAAVVLIAVSAVRYRQDIAVIWPQSAGVYSSLGLKVNAGGIDFQDVAYKRESEDGQVVLAVSGRIVNGAGRELPVPQTVRVTLSDGDNREIYHWTFKPSAAVLKPGQSVPFLTRLAAPPAAARHLEVRFARDTP
jgi:predicted Zn finger-like uncharacterized protein